MLEQKPGAEPQNPLESASFAQPEPDFTKFAGALRGELVEFLRRRTGDTHLAEDLVQETLLRLSRAPALSLSDPAARAYAYAAARNTSIDHWRMTQRDCHEVTPRGEGGRNSHRLFEQTIYAPAEDEPIVRLMERDAVDDLNSILWGIPREAQELSELRGEDLPPIRRAVETLEAKLRELWAAEAEGRPAVPPPRD